MIPRPSNGQRGQAIVEFAIASIAFIMLVFGLIQVAIMMFVYHSLAYGAEWGTRYAMVRGSVCTYSDCPATTSSVKAAILKKTTGINANNLTVTLSYMSAGGAANAGCKATGCLVQVKTSYDYQFPLINKTLTLNSVSQAPIAQ